MTGRKDDATLNTETLQDRLLRLGREYRPSMHADIVHSWGAEAAEAMKAAAAALGTGPKDSNRP